MPQLAGSSKLLRGINESATLQLLLERGSLTRGELRTLTGLSKPTTSEVLRRLTEAGLAVLAGHTTGGPGPNAEIYAANPRAGYAVAVTVREKAEVSQTSLSTAVCDLLGRVVTRHHEDVQFGSDTDPVDVVSSAVRRLCRTARLDVGRVQHVHLGLPGSYDAAAGVLRHIDVPGWRRPGWVDELGRRLGATVGVENDVNLAAIAERNRGVAAGTGSFTLIWFGQGLGLAIDLGGMLVRGARGGAGEIGYMPVGSGRDEGPTDLQDLLGGPAVAVLAVEHGLAGSASPEEGLAAVRASCDPARTGPPDRHEAFLDALAQRIAWGVAAVAAVLDPELIVLAGELARVGGARLTQRVEAALRAASPLDTTIAVTAIDDDPVLLGALDAALGAVRTTLIDKLRNAVPAA